MSNLKTRLAAIEKRASPKGKLCTWMPPALSVEAGREHEPEFEGRLAAIRRDAERAGWTPGCGRPWVIIARLPPDETLPEDDDETPLEDDEDDDEEEEDCSLSEEGGEETAG